MWAWVVVKILLNIAMWIVLAIGGFVFAVKTADYLMEKLDL